MKLAFCLLNYFPHGGLQRDFFRIATACHKRDHEIHVYTLSWRGDHPIHFHLHLLHTHGSTNATRAKNFDLALQKELATTHFDCVIGFNRLHGLDIYFAADLCYQATARQKHGFLYRCLPRYKDYVALENAVFSPASKTRILLLTEKAKTAFQRYYQTPDARFAVLPPAIAPDRIMPFQPEEYAAIRARFHLYSSTKLLLCIGSGFHNKGWDRAIKAVAALPREIRTQTQLWIAGKDKTLFWRLRAHCSGIAKQVHFLGIRNDVMDLMRAANLLIHPARVEAAGMVLLEAMGVGLPILATAACGYAEQVQRATAGIVLKEPFAQNDLNNALAMMLTSPLQATWRAQGSHYVAQLTADALTHTVVRHIENTQP